MKINRSKAAVPILWLLVLGIFLTGCRGGGGKLPETEIEIETETEMVRVRFLKTAEDADCIMISCGDRAVMIDTGEEQDGERMLEALEEQGITSVDYLFLTHPDKDHVGGAALLLESLPVYHVVEPFYQGEEKKEERFDGLEESCGEKGIPVIIPTEEWTADTGYLEFTVYPPQETFYEKANNYSLAVLVSHGDVHMFFTGDALRIRSEELLELSLPEIDLFKVPHHGRANKATEALFEKVAPEYAVVTAYSAEEEVKQSCEGQGAGLFLTGDQDWEFISDGKELYPVGGE